MPAVSTFVISKLLGGGQNNVNASNATGTDVNESRLREEMKENTSNMLEDHPSTQDLARASSEASCFCSLPWRMPSFTYSRTWESLML